MFEPGKNDSSESLILDPLEVRSFRINFNKEIQDKEVSIGKVSAMYDAK